MSEGAVEAAEKVVRREAGKTRPPVGLLCVLGAALLLAGAAGVVRVGGASEGSDLRRVEVKSVVLDSRTRQPIVLLEEKEGGLLLPIWIGPAEAQAIMMELTEIKPPRPMTHDLIRNIIGDLKAKVLRVVITKLREGTFYAQIVIAALERELTVDSRPSDAIALALRTRSPIFARRAVMRAGIAKETGESMSYRQRLGMVLQKMNPALAQFFGGGRADGLLVSQVDSKGAAARAGLRRGDVIFEVENGTVTTVEAFEEEFLRHPDGLTLGVRRGKDGKRLVVRLPAIAGTGR